MKRSTPGLAFLMLFLFVCGSAFAAITPIALDNADYPMYGPQPNNSWNLVNGNSDSVSPGYDNWTLLDDRAVGWACSMAGGGDQVEGNWSFALNGASGLASISRPLFTNVSGFARFEVDTRFNLGSAGTNLFALRANNSTTNFSDGMLLSFGMMTNTNQLGFTDLTGTHLLTTFDARTNAWRWQIDLNTLSGTFSGLLISNGASFSTFSGSLRLAQTNVRSFAVISSSSGSLIFDVPEFSVPEPAVFSLVAVGMGMLIFWRRPRQAPDSADNPEPPQ